MRTFPSEEALVAAYWKKLARSIEQPGVEKLRNISPPKSSARPGVRQRFAGSQNAKPTLATRRPRKLRLRSGRTSKMSSAQAVPR
jgi:hypothetical protein